jgi:hypothetical protein
VEKGREFPVMPAKLAWGGEGSIGCGSAGR